MNNPHFEIVPGQTPEETPVHRVVEYQDDVCLGGRGSFFRREYAELYVTALLLEGN